MGIPALPDHVDLPGVERANGAVTLDYMADDQMGPILYEGGNFRDAAVLFLSELDSMIPSGVEVRIHFTGDIVRSTNELDPRYADGSYTVERGANTVSAKTIQQLDGSYDILFGPLIWLYRETEGQSQDENLVDLYSRVRHSILHEAGHVAIDARQEDTPSVIPSVDELDYFEQVWSRHMGYMLEDYRIELGLIDVAPNPDRRALGFGEDLAHFDGERARSYQAGPVDGDYRQGLNIMIDATVHLTRALAYLAAETNDPTPDLAGEDLERWQRLIAPTWPLWLTAFSLASSALQPMTRDALATAIEGVSMLPPVLMQTVGVKRTVDADGNEAVHWHDDMPWETASTADEG